MGISSVTSSKNVSWQEFANMADELVERVEMRETPYKYVYPVSQGAIALAQLVAQSIDAEVTTNQQYYGQALKVALTNDRAADACLVFYETDKYGGINIKPMFYVNSETVEQDTQRRTEYIWPWNNR